MKDELTILGVLALVVVLAFSLTGKSASEIFAEARQKDARGESTFLSINDYVPPQWIGENTAQPVDTTTVIDTNDSTNSATVFVSKTQKNSERSRFANSASQDDRHGKIIIVAKSTNTHATASVTHATSLSTAQLNFSSGALLLLVGMLMVLVILVYLTGCKKKRLRHGRFQNLPQYHPHVPSMHPRRSLKYRYH